MSRTRRVPKFATVVRTEQVAPDFVRVVLGGDDIAALAPLEFTDHYVKLLFPPPGADYRWPFDPDGLRETHPREAWPVTRTYTIRWLDRSAGELASELGLAPPAMSRHLRAMKEGGLVEDGHPDFDARVRIYSLKDGATDELKRWLAETEALWMHQLGAFKRHVEDRK